VRLTLRPEAREAHRNEERWRHLIPGPVLDAAIAIGVAVLGLASGLGARAQGEHVPAAALPVLAAMGLSLFPRRRFPAAALAAVAVMVLTLEVLRAPLGGTFLAVLCACYSAAVYGSRRFALGLTVGAMAAFLTLGIPNALGVGGSLLGGVPIPTILAGSGAVLVGMVIRSQFATRSAHIAVLAERARWASAQAAQEARRATLAERLRIARELHDIVAHHLSVVVIQAQGAQRMVGRDPARAQQALADIEQTGRTALAEMRRLLGLLRAGDPDPDADGGGDRLPALGVADVSALVERMAAAGLPVTVRTTGEARPVPEDVGLSVYRITQEALTNVLRHAGPAEAEVHLHYGDELEISITDNGRGASASLSEEDAAGAGPAGGVRDGGPRAGSGLAGSGRGTTGMRERIAALGGRLTVGPQPGGGFRVHAVIPGPYRPAGPAADKDGLP
jgi:signal transduction histidine kinase